MAIHEDSPPFSTKCSTLHAKMATQLQNLQRQMEKMSEKYDRQLAILQSHDDRHRGRRLDRGIEGVEVKVSTFHGKNDPQVYLKWEMKMEQFFQSNSYNERKKVKVASLKFKDYALVWWNQLQKERKRYEMKPIETWAEMKKIMRRRHVPYHYHEVLHNKSKKEDNITTSKEVVAKVHAKKPMEAFPNLREKEKESEKKNKEKEKKSEENSEKISEENSEKKSEETTEKKSDQEKNNEENIVKISDKKESCLAIKSEENEALISSQPQFIFHCNNFYLIANATNVFSLPSGVVILLQKFGDFIPKKAPYDLGTSMDFQRLTNGPTQFNSRSNSLKEGGDDMSQGGTSQLLNKDDVSSIWTKVQERTQKLDGPMATSTTKKAQQVLI